MKNTTVTTIAASKKVITNMMDRGIRIDKACKEHCRDFRIMTSSMHRDTLILRWTTIDITDIDRPIQQYRYECFDIKGSPQYCSIYYTNQNEANAFFESLKTLYAQECAIDHKL